MTSPAERLRRGLSSAYLSACRADMALVGMAQLAPADQQEEVRRLATLAAQLRRGLRARLDGAPVDPASRPVWELAEPPRPTLDQVMAKQVFTCRTCNGQGWVQPYRDAGEHTRENCPDCRGSGLVGPAEG